MNKVLELQKLGQETEGKGQAAEATPVTWTVTTTSIFASTVSNHC